MIRIAAIAILVLRLIYQPSYAQPQIVSFEMPDDQPKISALKAGIINNKVVLKWTVEKNNMTDQFEIEKCTDGTHFVLAALVFGTEDIKDGRYEFYEKAGNQKVVYRVKLIGKNRETVYSNLIEVSPGS